MNTQLESLRKQIDQLDDILLDTLAKRVEVVKAIGEYKKTQGLPALDQERWQKVLRSRINKGQKRNLSKDFTKNLYTMIHKQSLEIENNI